MHDAVHLWVKVDGEAKFALISLCSLQLEFIALFYLKYSLFFLAKRAQRIPEKYRKKMLMYQFYL